MNFWLGIDVELKLVRLKKNFFNSPSNLMVWGLSDPDHGAKGLQARRENMKSLTLLSILGTIITTHQSFVKRPLWFDRARKWRELLVNEALLLHLRIRTSLAPEARATGCWVSTQGCACETTPIIVYLICFCAYTREHTDVSLIMRNLVWNVLPAISFSSSPLTPWWRRNHSVEMLA